MKRSTLITAIIILGAIIFIAIMFSVKAQESPDAGSSPSEQPTQPSPNPPDDDNEYDPNEQEYHNASKSSTK